MDSKVDAWVQQYVAWSTEQIREVMIKEQLHTQLVRVVRGPLTLTFQIALLRQSVDRQSLAKLLKLQDVIGIACRTPAADANWQLAFSAGGEGDPNGYGTASDRLHEAADAFLGENVDGAPLDAERERALITRGWNAD